MALKKRILVADADALESEFFKVMLDKLGYEADTIANGNEALEKVRAERYDMFILESALPGKSGLNILRALNEKGTAASLPVILLSAADGVNEEVEAFELGVEDYIRKPFNFSVVIARIRRRMR